jgi:methylphosphotriester-DNA--protein-cysteine methyltransferase
MKKKLAAIMVLICMAFMLIAAAAKPDFKYVGSKATKGKLFHRYTCAAAKKIADKNAVYFKDFKDAKSQGFNPCSICKPD